MNLILDDTAKEFLIKEGSHLDYGARPLRRAIEQRIEDPLSEELLQGIFEGKDTILVSGILNNKAGDVIDRSKVTTDEETGRLIDEDGNRVKIVRLDFQGEARGLPES